MASYHQATSTRANLLGVDLCVTSIHPVPWGYHRTPGCPTLNESGSLKWVKRPVLKSNFTQLGKRRHHIDCHEGNFPKAFATAKGVGTPPFHRVAA